MIANADRCVACGLCLPRCPTYQRAADESESPRGRIALVRAYALGQLPPSDSLRAHIDHCLGCQACEAVCPSRVPYDRILGDARALLAAEPPRPRAYHALLHATRSPRLLALAYDMARAGARTGFVRLLPRPLRVMPTLPPRPAYHTPARRKGTNPVSLFLGCTHRLEGDALDAAMAILRHHGFAVSIPRTQGCCGALARHAGAVRLAAAQEERNRSAFTGQGGPVVGLASGCVAALAADRLQDPSRFPQGVYDIHQFLADAVPDNAWNLASLPKTIAVHEPCSLRNALKATEAVYTLLRRIPDARVVPLPDNTICCGGAGDHFLREPELATPLRAAKQAAIHATQPDIVVSANIGCRLQMAAGTAPAVPIVHPLVVLAGQLAPHLPDLSCLPAC